MPERNALISAPVISAARADPIKLPTPIATMVARVTIRMILLLLKTPLEPHALETRFRPLVGLAHIARHFLGRLVARVMLNAIAGDIRCCGGGGIAGAHHRARLVHGESGAAR